MLQRFLTEARWDDNAVTARLQQYLAPRLTHPQAVWAVDESGVVKQGKKSAGVARQYCGAVGKVANCQMGVFLAHVGPRGRALVDKRLYLPRGMDARIAERCEAAGVPEEERTYQSKAELALGLLTRAQDAGTSSGAVGHRRRRIWQVARVSRRSGCSGLVVYAGSAQQHPRLAGLDALVHSRSAQAGTAIPSRAQKPTQRQEVRERAAALPAGAWQAITVAEGAQGPRTYLFAFERRRESRDGEPGEPIGVVYRKNLDGSEPRYYFTNAPEDTPADTKAWVAAARWPIETEFEANKSHVGLDEYEVRGWQGWNHHITLCLLASAFLLTLAAGLGGKSSPRSRVRKSIGWSARSCRASIGRLPTCSGGLRTPRLAMRAPSAPTSSGGQTAVRQRIEARAA